MNNKNIPCENTEKIVKYIKSKFNFDVIEIKPNEFGTDADCIYLGEKRGSVWLVVTVHRPDIASLNIPNRRADNVGICVKLDHMPGCIEHIAQYPEKARKEFYLGTTDFNLTDLVMLKIWYNDAKYWFNKMEKMYAEFTLG